MPKTKQNENFIDLWDFCDIASHGSWKPVPHLNMIVEFLHYAYNGQLENFACALSPRLGKSTIISEIFPAYILGMRPYAKIIHVSYSDSIARSFGGKAKNILDEFGHIFHEKPILSQDTKSKNWFKLKNNTGEYFCSGSSGSVLGRGANFIIVDDPSKNIEEARSERRQEKIIDLFDTTISTRKEKDPITGQNAVTIVVHQRLDQHDLIGIILEKREWITAEEALTRLRRGEKLGQIWVYLRLPELAEENDILGRKPGEALWPEKRDEKELALKKKDIGEIKFNTIYQQNPQPIGDKLLKLLWIKYYEPYECPPLEKLDIYQGWDLAISEKTSADYTVCTTIGVSDENKVYVLDWYHEQIDFPTQVKMVTKMYEKWKPLEIGIEVNNYQKALAQTVEQNSMLPIKEITSTTDKVRRISSGFVQFENEKVLLPKKHSELENFIKEYVNFPHRKYHDDMLDSLELTLQLTRTPVYDLDVYGLIVGDYDYEDDYY